MAGAVVSAKVIKYVGTADAREISKKDWKQAGIDHNTVRWDRSNGFTVLSADITNKEAMAVIEADDGLVVKDADV